MEYDLAMVAFTLLDIEGTRNGKMRTRVSNVAVEIRRGCRLTLELDTMLALYVILLSKFNLEEQLIRSLLSGKKKNLFFLFNL